MDVFNATSDNLFTPATSDYSSQMQSMSLRTLNKGLSQFTAKHYGQAIATFKQAVNFSPTSDSAVNAYDYMARSYLAQGDNKSAIDAYKKAIKAAPTRDDLNIDLGNIYTTQKDYSNALKQYQHAVKSNASTANLYSLGQGYLGTGQTDQAMLQFQKLAKMQPNEPYGAFGIGQTYAKEGNYRDAINSFQTAISKKNNYLQAYSEMGYAYVDSGQSAMASQVVNTLNTLSPGDTTLATSLSKYIFDKSKPKITGLASSDLYAPFLAVLGPGTQISAMGYYNLSQASGNQTVSMVFQFNKPMDQSSVENVNNWTIARATGKGYDYNMTPPSTDINLQPTPIGVYYDATKQTATVLFNLQQNATANGTIDPSHIDFSFSGKDVTGLSMDPKANMYSGFTGVA